MKVINDIIKMSACTGILKFGIMLKRYSRVMLMIIHYKNCCSIQNRKQLFKKKICSINQITKMLMYTKIPKFGIMLIKVLLNDDKDHKNSFNVRNRKQLQSNFPIPTPGFHVTPLITSVFQSPDFSYMILM